MLPKTADNGLVRAVVTCNTRTTKPAAIYRAQLGSALKGVVFQVSERGYSGEILVLMAVMWTARCWRARAQAHRNPWSGRQTLKSPKTIRISKLQRQIAG